MRKGIRFEIEEGEVHLHLDDVTVSWIPRGEYQTYIRRCFDTFPEERRIIPHNPAYRLDVINATDRKYSFRRSKDYQTDIASPTEL